tara:strand:- start:466 stop:750 length:285 start_codon:yes stop_codon:yes gene_type:complete
MSVTTFVVYEDPTNSWVKVPKSTVRHYFGHEWRQHFTSYSYERKDHVYLENLRDSPTFVNKMRRCGVEPKFRKKVSTVLSRIRNYDCLAPIEMD